MAQTSNGGSQPVDPPGQRPKIRRVKVQRPSSGLQPTKPPFLAVYGLDIFVSLAFLLAGVALTNSWHRLFTVDTTIGGVVLLILAFALGLIRLRHHLLHSERWLNTRPCPRCGHPELKRTPRKPWHNLVGDITDMPLRRYICPQCAWKGTRLDETKIRV